MEKIFIDDPDQSHNSVVKFAESSFAPDDPPLIKHNDRFRQMKWFYENGRSSTINMRSRFRKSAFHSKLTCSINRSRRLFTLYAMILP